MSHIHTQSLCFFYSIFFVKKNEDKDVLDVIKTNEVVMTGMSFIVDKVCCEMRVDFFGLNNSSTNKPRTN